MTRLSKYEQEVVLLFNAEEDTATVTAADPVWIRKFDKLVEQNPEQFKMTKIVHYEDGTVCSKRYEFPKRFVSIRSKDKKVEMTDEQRAKASARMKELHQNQKFA